MAETSTMIPLGTTAPYFTLPDTLSGERISLGKVDLKYVHFGKEPAPPSQGMSLNGWVSWILACLGFCLFIFSF